MQTNTLTAQSKPLIALLTLITLAIGAQAGTTQLSSSPLSGASSVEISPNILFVLDDSLSMKETFLPDWAGGYSNSDTSIRIPIALWQSRNSSFNGVAYNPAFTYLPPIFYTAGGAIDTVTYPVQNAAYTANWTAVKRNAYLSSSTLDNLVGNAYYFTTVPGEYCTNAGMRSCSTTSTSFPARLRWCNSAATALLAAPADNACQATEVDNKGSTDLFGYPRMPSPRTSTVNLSAGGSVDSITVDGKQILSGIAAGADSAALALAISDKINACTFGVAGATWCQVVGYRAVANAGTLTIYSPKIEVFIPAITSTPSLIASPSAFARPSDNLAPGENLLTVITSTTTTYPKASTRSDCGGATCSYAEEMTNYANWWTYYRTRMQTMKTASSLAFAPLGTGYRVGLMTVDNNTGTDTMGNSFLNINNFNATQKYDWYRKLFAATPTADTPLRRALAQAGRLYAGKIKGVFNGQDPITDPVQFSCQQNVTILSTDGYWNDLAGFKLDGSTAVGDQDAIDSPGGTSAYNVLRPQLDGGAPIYKRTTAVIQQTMTPQTPTWLQNKVDKIQSQQKHLQSSTKTQAQEQTSTLQKQISTLQTQSAPLQSQTSQLQTATRDLQQRLKDVVTISTLTAWTYTTQQTYKSTKFLQAQQKTQPLQYKQSKLGQQTSKLQISTSTLKQRTSTLQQSTSKLQRNVSQVQQRTSTDGGTNWSGWSDVASCIPVDNEKDCKLLAPTGWVDATSSCSIVTPPTSDNPHVYNPGTDAKYTLFTTKSDCKYTGYSSAATATECTPVSQSTGSPYTVVTAVNCSYTDWTAKATAGECTPLSQSSGTAKWTVDTATQCSYTTPTGFVDATSTCTTTPQSSGTGKWTVGTAVSCAYTGYAPATPDVVGTCTNKAQSTASPFTQLTATTCSYGAWDGSWNNASSACTPKDQSSGSGEWSGPAMQCRYGTLTDWADVGGSCTVTPAGSIDSFSVVTGIMACQTVDKWTNPAASACAPDASTNCTFGAESSPSAVVATCNPGTSGTGLITKCTAAYTTPVPGACVSNPPATICGTTWGGWNTVTTCDNNGTTSQCRYVRPSDNALNTWSTYTDVTSPSTCKIKTASTGTGTWTGPMRDCIYASFTPSTPANDPTCFALVKSSGSADGTVYTVNVAKQCSYGSYSTLIDVVAPGPCTVVNKSTANPYVAAAVNCQWTDSLPVPASSCDEVAKTSTSTPFTQLSATHCSYTGFGSWSNVGSCTKVLPSDGPTNYTVATARNCQFVFTPFADVDTCTAVADNTQCGYGSPSWVTTPLGCTLQAVQSGPNYTQNTATLDCKTTPVTGWGPAPPFTNEAIAGTACTAGPNASNNTVSCQTVLKKATPPTPVSPVIGCPKTDDDGTPEHNAIACTTVTTGPDKGATCSELPAAKSPDWIKISCQDTYDDATPDTLADVAQYYYMNDLRDASLSNCPGALGDDVCRNDVPASGTRSKKPNGWNDADYWPAANWQHMSTYTLGLGASGLMQYDPNYLKDTVTSGDFYSIKKGLAADPVNGICSWQSRGACNWPKPVSDSQTNIDDLWHAAVNGGGSYFSTTDPGSLAAGISGALAIIGIKEGALSAVSVSNPNLAAGDNSVFEVSFKAGEWSGDLVKRTIDPGTGVLSATLWSAQAKLDEKVTAGTHTHLARTIYTFDPSATDKLKPFLWANLSVGDSTERERNYFRKPNIASLTQFCSTGTNCLSTATQDDAEGENLLNFVRGEKTHQGLLSDLSTYYRDRTHLLGDIVGSEAVFVKGSPWNYADSGYFAFKSLNTSRTSMVYVAANDGMLHAFYSNDQVTGACVIGEGSYCGGEEAWAYVPAIVMPKLYKLADKNYPVAGVHQFMVDGTPVMGDICPDGCPTVTSPATSWKTILVGGLNNGGRGYYALDITDPAAPKALWEFTDDNLGYTYGNPVITKLKDGTWVVIVASGYNNVSPGDGVGRLFILNANTGELIPSIPTGISTGVGDTTTPSGLSRITAWANFPDNNNTAQRVYGGDLLGNLWRFDVNGDIPAPSDPPVAADYDAQRLATLKDASGNAQPITSKPELGKIKNFPVVFVATGQLLGSTDLATTQRQSLYAIKDKLTVTDLSADPPTNGDYGNPRLLTTTFISQTLTAGVCLSGNKFCAEDEKIVTSTKNPVDFTANDGWYTDFPVAGERVNTDLRLQLGTLILNTNTPKDGACVPVGVSYAYFLDYLTGGYVEGTNGMAGVYLGDYLSSPPSVVRLTDGTIKVLIRTDKPATIEREVPTAPTPFNTRRVSWRELVTE